MLIMYGWSDVEPSFGFTDSIVINSAHILANLIILPRAQNQYIGRSMQPLMSLVNLMKHREKVGGTELD